MKILAFKPPLEKGADSLKAQLHYCCLECPKMVEVKVVRRVGFKNLKEEALREIEEGLVEAVKGEGKSLEDLVHASTVASKD